jgi:predicted permease
MGREGWRVRGMLVAAELTLAVMLLAGAGLLIRSFGRLQAVDPGFTSKDLLTFQLSLPDARYPAVADAARFYPRLLEQVRAIPGVASAEAITGLPLDDYSYSMSTPFLDGVRQDPTKEPSTQIRIVTRGLFQTMGIRVLRGRGFAPVDRLDAPGAVVLSESAAARLFPGQDAIGHTMEIGSGFGLNRGRAGGTVVGIVEDIHDRALGTPPRATTYLLHDQWPVTDLALVVQAPNPVQLVPGIREALKGIDPLLPMVATRTMEQVTATSTAQPRFVMLLLAAFAVVALVLAAIGVFGVMSYVVGQRTREIGVRIALGAGGRTVVAETVRRALAPVVIGVVVGIVGALALSRTIATLLYDVTPGDPLTYGTVAAVLASVAVLAAWVPARRASRVDPVIALRAE